MNRSHALSILLLLPAMAAAQQEPGNQDPRDAAWQRFVRDHGDWSSQWSKATGTPSAIYGPGLRLQDGPIRSVPVARAHAEATLARFADLLGRGASTFVEVTGVAVGHVYVFVYDQQFRGLPVIGGRADVRIHDNGVLSMFGSRAVDIPAGFDVMPRIDADNAVGRAHVDREVERRFAARAVAGPRLVIWADVEGTVPTSPRLAWEVQIDDRTGADPIVGKAYVDARSGQVFDWIDEVYTCGFDAAPARDAARAPLAEDHPWFTVEYGQPASPPADITGVVMSWVLFGPPGTPLQNVPLPNLRVQSSAGTAFTDATGVFRIPNAGNQPVQVTVDFTSGSSSHLAGGLTDTLGNPVQATVTATPGTPVTIQLLDSTAPDVRWAQTTTYWHVDDANRWIRGLVGNGSEMDRLSGLQATVNIDNNCNAYYSSYSINFYTAGGNCNNTAFDGVVYHEWGHGLDHTFGGISNSIDGLSEGWGDVLNNYRLDDPIVGRGFRTNGNGIRDANNNATYPNGNEVHQMGLTWMGFAWGVREGLKRTLGSGPGVARAEAIVVASIVADATNQPDAVREVFILDDDDGNLDNGVPNYGVLSAEALRRRLPFPEIRVGTISHTEVGNSTDQLRPRIVRASVVPISGSFSSVTLVYDDGSGTVNRAMAASGNPDEYIGLLPGKLAPASIDYHIEARHSTGIDIRFPAQGELEATVAAFQEHYFENFESGDNGWTHGQTRRQDDWQRGTPQGKSGTSNGVAWADPSAAVSGTNAWGNDLGIGNFNGAYQPNVTNFLRSPLIDLSGQQNVLLRYQRWLTVEEGIYDQAEIRVNGQVVWANAQNGHHLDTGWVEHEVRIAPADNNPATQLEWRLNTDGGLNLGGWAIDDVRLLTAVNLPPPDVVFTLTPAQIGFGASSNVDVAGEANAVAAILLADTPGPTILPGLPVLHVGANFVALPIQLDGSGNFATVFNAPNLPPGTTGKLYYSQVIQLNNAQLKTSNKMVILLGP